MRIVETFPELAQEVEQLLIKQGQLELAAQVPELDIVERCRCGDDFCATIYTQLKPDINYGPNHRSFDLDSETGMIILDAVDGKIACIEILNRDDVRKILLKVLP